MKKLMFILITLLTASLQVSAYDFMVDDIAYNFNNDGTSVTVTYEIAGDCSYSNLSGDVTIPSSINYNGSTYSVTSIGQSAFYNCTALTSVTIGNSVTEIGERAFSGCSGLTSVTIPNSVTSIGTSAFSGCTGLTSVDISDLAAWCNIDFYDDSSNPLFNAHNLYLNGSKVTNLVIPNSITKIKQSVFSGCIGLTSVTIPNSVTSIGNGAFHYCSGLTSVTIPNSVTSIGRYVFSGCTGLTSVTWNAKNCFTIANGAPFYNLMGITSFNFGNEVENIPASLCNGLTGLTSVTIPNSVISIGNSAFNGCISLTSVTIPNLVTSIGISAFYRCTGLTSVTIGNSVTSIGTSAFSGCSKIRTIYSKIVDPESVSYGVDIFQGVITNYCKLYVPAGKVEDYQFTAPWSDFLNILEEGSGSGGTPVYGDVNGDGVVTAADVTAVYDILLGVGQ
ncbi:MAG: leucine-rich repeat protein [Muribaculaceae bacterium]|nr:leucine-rich repeat protein [Muribaculaceae bacterium]